MTIHLSPRGEELLEAALARGMGNSPEEVVERALEAAGDGGVTPSGGVLDRSREAVAGMFAFRNEYNLKLAPGERTQDLIGEARKY